MSLNMFICIQKPPIKTLLHPPTKAPFVMIILENELSKVIKDNEQDDSLQLIRRQRQYLKQNYNNNHTPVNRDYWYAIIMT